MVNDLVEDIRNSPEIMAKIRAEDRYYAQNLYCAWCNMQWAKKTAWMEKGGKAADLGVVEDDLWSASWRGAGGIVADLRNKGEDYMDYYCSGIRGGFSFDGKDDDEYFERTRYVSEGYVTEEIANDLSAIGWMPVPYDDSDLV